MTSEYVDGILSCEASRMEKTANPFLKNGFAGLCLFSFGMYEMTSQKKYYQMGLHCLRRTCESIKRNSKVNIAEGLSGIGIVILQVFRKGLVNGDVNEVLKNVDDEIYRSVTQALDYNERFLMARHEMALMNVAQYMTERVKFVRSEEERKIYELFVNKILNRLYMAQDAAFYLEPTPYTSDYMLAHFILLLRKAHEVKLCTNRVLHIWEENRRLVLAQTPYFDCNKLLLLFALSEMHRIVPNDIELSEKIDSLRKSISVKKIVEIEMPDNAMHLMSGLTGLVQLMFRMDVSFTKDDWGMLKSKMEVSDYFNMEYKKIAENNFTGLDGILGYILTYLRLEIQYGED